MQINTDPDYLASQGLSANFPHRFFAKVFKTESCWLWTAGLNDSGYGQISRAERRGPIRAHVASWILHFGPVPNGKCVLHNCPFQHNRKCVNPTHLKLGTRDDNWKDAIRMGSAKFPKPIAPAEVHTAKLDWKRVKEIRESRKPIKELAVKYAISRSAIERVLSYKSWKA